jgi:O-6-methylguanine DNA methyltransferase
MPSITYHAPTGPLALEADGDGRLTRVGFGEAAAESEPEALAAAVAAFDAYFAGDPAALRALPVDLAGTPFQEAVWERLREIPAGETMTYTALAAAVGRPGAIRAVGAAVGRTPVPVVVPCHRVVGADGSLTGYAGGLEMKAALLAHEQGVMPLAAG